MTEKSNEVRKAAVQVISYLLKGVDTDLLQVMITIIFLPYLTLNFFKISVDFQLQNGLTSFLFKNLVNFQIHGLTSLFFKILVNFEIYGLTSLLFQSLSQF